VGEDAADNPPGMVVPTLKLTSAPPGNYVVEYKLHDIASDKTAIFEMPFKIAS
jgi:hypothetical protein